MNLINLKDAPLVEKAAEGSTLFVLNPDGSVNRISAENVGGTPMAGAVFELHLTLDTSNMYNPILNEKSLTYEEAKNILSKDKARLNVYAFLSSKGEIWTGAEVGSAELSTQEYIEFRVASDSTPMWYDGYWTPDDNIALTYDMMDS